MKRLLLVDDVELFLQLEMSFLNRSGFEIHTARRGSEALAVAREVKPHLVLLDLHLPDMAGDEVCRHLKEDDAAGGPVVVMVSSGREAEDRKRLLASGCEAVILKPVNKEELCRVVETQLGICQRLHRRVDTDLDCLVKADGVDYRGVIRSLGQGGVFVALNGETPSVGSRVCIRFALPGGRADVAAFVQVRWRGVKGHNGPEGAGMKFLEISEGDRQAVGIYVERQLSRLGPTFIPAGGAIA